MDESKDTFGQADLEFPFEKRNTTFGPPKTSHASRLNGPRLARFYNLFRSSAGAALKQHRGLSEKVGGLLPEIDILNNDLSPGACNSRQPFRPFQMLLYGPLCGSHQHKVRPLRVGECTPEVAIVEVQ
jgi:hypothetical protein